MVFFFLQTAGASAPPSLPSAVFFAQEPPSEFVKKLLLCEGADPFARSENGSNSAHWATFGGFLDVCKFLHEELGMSFTGKDVENNDGETPLEVALAHGHKDVAEWIKKL